MQLLVDILLQSIYESGCGRGLRRHEQLFIYNKQKSSEKVCSLLFTNSTWPPKLPHALVCP